MIDWITSANQKGRRKALAVFDPDLTLEIL